MQRLTRILGLGAVALFLFAGTFAHAQNLPDELYIKVPFTFHIENTKLPAGEYMIRAIDSAAPLDLILTNLKDTVDVDFLTSAAWTDSPSTQPELEFQKFGNEYFLSRIWLENQNRGFAVLESRRQQKLEASGQHGESHRVEARHVHR
jgi:hypothetical protein